jgi:hypothetical protein
MLIPKLAHIRCGCRSTRISASSCGLPNWLAADAAAPPSSVMNARRFTARCLPCFRAHPATTEDCCAAEFQFALCRVGVNRVPGELFSVARTSGLQKPASLRPCAPKPSLRSVKVVASPRNQRQAPPHEPIRGCVYATYMQPATSARG